MVGETVPLAESEPVPSFGKLIESIKHGYLRRVFERSDAELKMENFLQPKRCHLGKVHTVMTE
jgi:hypothetical protein